MNNLSLFEELKRRRVFQVAAIYVAVAWGVTEIVVTIVDTLFLSERISTLAVIAFIAGFPVAMFLAWTFDITPEGVQRATIRSRRGKASILLSVVLLVLSTAALFVLIKPVERGSPASQAMPNSIAVMPFDNSGGNPEDDYLIVGLGDELRDQLSQVTGLRMAARSSSIVARRQALDAIATSEKLGVEVLIEGSVRRRGANLLVSVELVEGSSGLVLWNNTFSRTDRELVAVQQSIVDQILEQVTDQADGSILATPSTYSSSANELMLLARHYENQVREQVDVDATTLSRAIDLYRQATEADPKSALANSRLARALMYANDFAGAEAPIFRAMTINSELSEVQNTLGNYYLATGVRGAGIAFRRATGLNANNADALADYAWWLWMQSRADESESLYRRALELDPLSLSRYGALADYYGYTARIPEALEIASRVLVNFDDADGYRLISRIMELVGRLDESIAWAIRARDLQPENNDHVIALAELYAEIGDFDTALGLNPNPDIGLLFKMRRYKELIDVGEFLMIEQPGDLELQALLSYSYTVMGQPELAVRLLTLTGVPDRVLGERRHPMDVERFVYLMDALDASGETDTAQQLAHRSVERPHLVNEHWWVNLYVACPLAIVGRHDDALARLSRVGNSVRLPWESLIRDMHCFQRYENEPRYQAMLTMVKSRREKQLARLPVTLAEFDVSL